MRVLLSIRKVLYCLLTIGACLQLAYADSQAVMLHIKNGNEDLAISNLDSVDIDAINNSQDVTILHWAASRDMSKLLQKLLAKGVNTNLRTNKHGWTAIHIAAMSDASKAMNVLSLAGASFSLPDKTGWLPLHLSANTNNIKSLKYLISLGLDLNAKGKYNWSPLFNAAVNGNVEIVKFLVDNGADKKHKDIYDNSVAHYVNKNIAKYQRADNITKYVGLIDNYRKILLLLQ